jgi:hypothetical protein
MLRADTWLILAIGAVVGYASYRLMVDPLARRPEFRGRAYSRRAGTIVGALLFGLCALVAWLNLR